MYAYSIELNGKSIKDLKKKKDAKCKSVATNSQLCC